MIRRRYGYGEMRCPGIGTELVRGRRFEKVDSFWKWLQETTWRLRGEQLCEMDERLRCDATYYPACVLCRLDEDHTGVTWFCYSQIYPLDTPGRTALLQEKAMNFHRVGRPSE